MSLTPKEINDLKKEHNAAQDRGRELYKEMTALFERCQELYGIIQEAEGDEFDPIPLIFGEGFWIDEDL